MRFDLPGHEVDTLSIHYNKSQNALKNFEKRNECQRVYQVKKREDLENLPNFFNRKLSGSTHKKAPKITKMDKERFQSSIKSKFSWNKLINETPRTSPRHCPEVK